MRILFTVQPARGHLHPLVPLAKALAADGHDVVFASSTSFRPVLESFDLPVIPAGLDWLVAEQDQLFPQLLELRKSGADAANQWVDEHVFRGTAAARMAADLLDYASTTLPDVIVREPLEFGGAIAAEVLGLPHVVAGPIWFLPQDQEQRLGELLHKLRAAHGLPSDPGLTMLYRYMALATMPPDWVAPGEPVPPVTHFLRPESIASASRAPRPGWLDRPLSEPVVLATLGTIFNRTPGIFEAILEGLRQEDMTLVLTVGADQAPETFGPQPSNIHIEQYVPHEWLLPRCSLAIVHGGFSTIMAALSAGVPMVVVPIGSDQHRNAQRCADLGLAHVVQPDQRTPAEIRAVVRACLREPVFRQNAQRMQTRLLSLPGPEHAVALLDDLVAGVRGRQGVPRAVPLRSETASSA